MFYCCIRRRQLLFATLETEHRGKSDIIGGSNHRQDMNGRAYAPATGQHRQALLEDYSD